MSLQIPGHIVTHFSSIWSQHNELKAFHMSIFRIMSCGQASIIHFQVACTPTSIPPATP